MLNTNTKTQINKSPAYRRDSPVYVTGMPSRKSRKIGTRSRFKALVKVSLETPVLV